MRRPSYFFTELPRKLVSSRPFLPNGNFTPTFLRFTFTGGSNVKLEGSTDPQWGWVNSHGQQVGEKLLITDDCTHQSILVVGCDARTCVTGKPPSRVGFLEYHERRDQAHETVASEYRHCAASTTAIQPLCRLARSREFRHQWL